ncbi:MAG: conjugative transposon protein TraM [Tannerella sp.]|jgi:conjugative transposon TraM protein|nr:conjugative transposon protein TraM [Tannerella sp.]
MDTNSNRTDGNKPGLSAGQKQKLRKYAVFTLMGIICAGFMWLIFKPSASEKTKREQQSGFNADIPDPKNEGIVGDKATAYEQEQMRQKQAERMRSLGDFTALLGEGSPATENGDLALLSGEAAGTDGESATTPEPASVQNSVKAYREVNSALESFYETPAEDPEKELLQAELDELRERLDRQEQAKTSVEEQMALMEQSFQMAAKYMPVGGTAAGTAASAGSGAAGTNGTDGMAAAKSVPVAVPVSALTEQTVSALPQDIPDGEMMKSFGKALNMGFLTAAGETSGMEKNTVSACIHADQTLMDGESVRLRLLEPMQAGKITVPENSILSGIARIQGERLQIAVYSIAYRDNIIPVEISVFDTDGQKGIFIPDTKEVNAAREMVANMGTNAGTSISLSSDAGEQFVADMGRSAIQGISQFFSKKMREVKVSLKAGYRVFLMQEPPSSSPKGGGMARNP